MALQSNERTILGRTRFWGPSHWFEIYKNAKKWSVWGQIESYMYRVKTYFCIILDHWLVGRISLIVYPCLFRVVANNTPVYAQGGGQVIHPNHVSQLHNYNLSILHTQVNQCWQNDSVSACSFLRSRADHWKPLGKKYDAYNINKNELF